MPEFFDRYVTMVDQNTELIEGLEAGKNIFDSYQAQLFQKQDYRYQAHKWTPKDIMQHLIDNERIQSYRALVFARKDQDVLAGYDQEHYAHHAATNCRDMSELLEEFKALRSATIYLFKSFTDEQMHHEGVCFAVRVTVLALGFQVIGHT